MNHRQDFSQMTEVLDFSSRIPNQAFMKMEDLHE